ncbi:MAG: cell division protein FtsL [Gammaproteobacteria bacterium]|jgi:cell division protein FtsL
MRIIILAILFFLTAFAIVYFKHSNRQLLIELHDLQKQRDALNSEWSQLLLEESTLITHSRVERIATEELHMFVPKDKDIIWLPMDNTQ